MQSTGMHSMNFRYNASPLFFVCFLLRLCFKDTYFDCCDRADFVAGLKDYKRSLFSYISRAIPLIHLVILHGIDGQIMLDIDLINLTAHTEAVYLFGARFRYASVVRKISQRQEEAL
ncbi:hypothetical protein BIY37_01655 [Candidatus Brocadia sapporoensis]|uniref:Uncharacterized protein n=1 Tax=Candidatus Brocadia sapporoensis TaxID=392547 RepID=A0A1V6M2Z0_9BACT|nr:hypothetical protein [Candidatus Brocadia sapporoensis]MDG6006494.1 hypothetical protein [Candidatus Brocadia sp.]TVL98536.1 MAG: hypothetical protein CV082_00255 [Candidatus Brocadia sp. BL1]OQD46740.1 hypothetical protein BIY37_01655 [Candidatus Brocadia sapporoensis]GJQ22660.1 MAG: hypothetical protein HBSAPP01_04500 [Candidatus Brocadia sapporoensis]HQU29933.1 hypothetical protein [Candidatus Brocadia sapporoensis]